MAKKRMNKNGKKKAATPKKKRGGGAMAARGRGVLADPRVAAWDRLLRDPCAANLAAPCYGGVDSGYLVRTVDFLSPGFAGAGFTVGGLVVGDYVVQWTPFNLSSSTGVVYVGGTAGSTLGAMVAGGLPGSFVASATVKRYRPVASCVKWIPSGAYGTRSGTVSLGLSSGQELTAGTTYTLGAVRALAQHYCPNGSEAHEVRWLPTAVDENFTETSASNNTGAGSVFMALQGVDGTATSATSAILNGTIEVTTVWEWVPAGSGLASSPKAPLPYTSQQVLSTISDLGAFVFHGLRMGGEAMGGGVMRGAMAAGAQLLSRGVGLYGTRGPHMIMS